MKALSRITLVRLVLAGLSLAYGSAPAQQGTPGALPAPQSSPAPQASPTPPAYPPAQSAPDSNGSHGQVLFQSHGEPPAQETEPSQQDAGTPEPASGQPEADLPPGVPTVTDAERSALLFTAYDLDAHLFPSGAELSMRARVTVRNIGAAPLSRISLQVSSTLHWESASLYAADRMMAPNLRSAPTRLPLAQHLLDTDADHTGQANEVILTLPAPLAPQASATLDLFYSGRITPSAARLQRIGANTAQALDSDWDTLGAADPESSSSSTGSPILRDRGADASGLEVALRGFGDVLWYPVAEPQLFLGDGAELFHAIDQTRLRDRDTSVHLRVSVEFLGSPPAAVYFCGLRQPLRIPNAAAPSAGRAVTTAEFSAQPLGFRLPSLFIVLRPETLLAELPGSGTGSPGLSQPGPAARAISGVKPERSATNGLGEAPAPSDAEDASVSGTPMLAVESSDDGSLPRLADSAQQVAPLLQQWFGPRPLSTLTLLDHQGQPFEDGPLLVGPIASLAASQQAGALAHSLTHAWVQTGQAWMDEGLAEFMSLLWVEEQKGREAANAHLNELVQPLVLVEPDFSHPSVSAPEPAATVTAAARSGSAAPVPPDPNSAAVSSAPGPVSSSAASTSVSAAAGSEAEAAGQALTGASEASYYRFKAAAVWWMLRDIAGENPLRFALSAWRTQPISQDSPQVQAENFEKLLEKTSGKDLAWFFNDWVLRDRGLPDLSILNVTPRELPAGKGHDTGWLVAVTVRNEGAAAAEVPVVIRSGTFSTTKRVRIDGFGSSTERIVVEAVPTQVLVNDGSVPEVRSSTHVLAVVAKTQ